VVKTGELGRRPNLHKGAGRDLQPVARTVLHRRAVRLTARSLAALSLLGGPFNCTCHSKCESIANGESKIPAHGGIAETYYLIGESKSKVLNEQCENQAT
jgi:hypothetical protein